ncbi:MAG: hypothetical protein HUU46_07690 [Candidatus Hydrogenedentes bacterium]|nr:hypothetical protein [Candidatus Hydrogenedentota bacterium]
MSEQQSQNEKSVHTDLPENLRPVYDDLLLDFRVACHRNQGLALACDAIVADLVRAGWRCVDRSDKSWEKEREFQKSLWDLDGIPKDLDELFYEMEPWEKVASGYRRAAEILCDALAGSRPRSTVLLFPTLFCYRHFLELSIKGLLQLNAQLPATNRVKPPMGHILENLRSTLEAELSADVKSTTVWENAKVVDGVQVAGKQVGNVNDDLLLLKDWCDRFASADRESDRFRYPVDKDHAPYDFPHLQQLLGCKDVDELKSGMAKLSKAIHNISMAIAGEIEFG